MNEKKDEIKKKKMGISEHFLEKRNMIKEEHANEEKGKGVRCNYASDQIGFWFLVHNAGKNSLKKQRKNNA